MKTNFKKFALGTVALGASVLLLAGCGNSSKNESALQTMVTKLQVLK